MKRSSSKSESKVGTDGADDLDLGDVTAEELDSLYDPEVDDLEDAPYEEMERTRDKAMDEREKADERLEKVTEEYSEAIWSENKEKEKKLEKEVEKARGEFWSWEGLVSRAQDAMTGWFAIDNLRQEARDKVSRGGGGGGRRPSGIGDDEYNAEKEEWKRMARKMTMDQVWSALTTNKELMKRTDDEQAWLVRKARDEALWYEWSQKIIPTDGTKRNRNWR